MNILINLLLITCIIVFIIDLSGISDYIKKFIWKKFIKVGDYRNLELKPLLCSLCLTFWFGLIYLIIIGEFTLPFISIVCLYSLLTSNIGDFLIWFKDLLTKIINILQKLVE